MASNSDFQEEDFLCPICCDIFKDPVVLPCSHSACKTCIENYWRYQGCPVCLKKSSMSLPTVSLTLKRLSEVFLQTKNNRDVYVSDELCGRHKKKLKLFCLEDEKLVCLECRDTRRHKSHTLCPLEEAIQDYKASVETEMKIAKDKQMVYIQAIKRSFQTEKYIEMQAKRTVYHIEHHFGELYIFIDEEKKKSVGAINMEMISNIKMLKDKSEELSTTITCLSNKIRVVEEGLESDHVAFLQRYQAIRKLSRTHCTVPDPQLVSGALIDVVKHLGNLEFSVTQKLHQSRSYYPVILDPNTAHRDICVDKTLTEITMNDSDYSEDIDKHPGSPERFNLHPWILASEGFDSGINSWTVKIEIFKGCCSWAIGLLEGSVSRHGVIDKGVWSLVYDEDVYTAHSGSKEPVTLTLEKDLLTVRVALDWDQGLLSFFDVDNDLHIHTFKHIFRNKVYPFFSKKCDEHTLTILNGVS